MKGCITRGATAGDVLTIASLNAEVQALHFDNRPDQFKPACLPDIQRSIEQLLQNPAARVWVAESDEAVVGYLAVMVRDKPEGLFCPARVWWEVDQMGVASEHRRTGIGRALIQRVISEARSERIRDIELCSWAFNEVAHRAFESLGFAPKVVRFELLGAGNGGRKPPDGQ